MIHEWAIEIASEFPEGKQREKYMDAAKKLRIPYWDWAIDPLDKEEGAMPYTLRREREKVTRPDGREEEVKSPLFEYVFHPVVREEFDAVCCSTHTHSHPIIQ